VIEANKRREAKDKAQLDLLVNRRLAGVEKERGNLILVNVID
jgi:hypothetical protein